MNTKRARLMPARRSLRFIEGAGAVQHQNGARAAVVVRGLHIFVAQVRGAVGNLRDAAVELDEPVDCLGAAVAGAVGVEVGQERVLPLSQGSAEAVDLGDGAGREAVDDLLGELAAGI